MNLFERVQIVSAVAAVYGVIWYRVHLAVQDCMGFLESKFFATCVATLAVIGIAIVAAILGGTLYWVAYG